MCLKIRFFYFTQWGLTLSRYSFKFMLRDKFKFMLMKGSTWVQNVKKSKFLTKGILTNITLKIWRNSGFSPDVTDTLKANMIAWHTTNLGQTFKSTTLFFTAFVGLIKFHVSDKTILVSSFWTKLTKFCITRRKYNFCTHSLSFMKQMMKQIKLFLVFIICIISKIVNIDRLKSSNKNLTYSYKYDQIS